jgi:hypothetical protein
VHIACKFTSKALSAITSYRFGDNLGIVAGCGRMSCWNCLSLVDEARFAAHLFSVQASNLLGSGTPVISTGQDGGGP